MNAPVKTVQIFGDPDTVEISYLAIDGVCNVLAKLDAGPYTFENGKTNSEKIYHFAYDELRQETIEGLCVVQGELVVAIRRVSLPPTRVFLVDGPSHFGKREACHGFPFPDELLLAIGKRFLPIFAAEMKKLSFLTLDDIEHVGASRNLLSSDFSKPGLSFVRKHYHPLCLEVIRACEASNESDWNTAILKSIVRHISIFQS